MINRDSRIGAPIPRSGLVHGLNLTAADYAVITDPW